LIAVTGPAAIEAACRCPRRPQAQAGGASV